MALSLADLGADVRLHPAADFPLPMLQEAKGDHLLCVHPARNEEATIGTIVVSTHEQFFDVIRFWRGPTWIRMVCRVALGLEANGELEWAQRLRNGVAQSWKRPRSSILQRSNDVRSRDRSLGWTSALYLDVLHRQAGTTY